jgi:head-tail adaptor
METLNRNMADKAMKLAGAGELNKRVSIQRRSTTGSTLEPTVLYTADAQTRFCSVEPLSTRELLIREDSEVFSEATHRLKMRYWATPPRHQDCITLGNATWNSTTGQWSGGRVFEMLGEPRNIEERNRQIEMICVERIGQ